MKLLLFNFLILTGIIANAQTIKGTIKDANTGKGIGGATVMNVGTKKGIQADSLGNFIINATGNLKLSFSATGYANLDTTIVPGTNSTIQIALMAAAEELEEVVIVSSSRTNSRIEDLPTKVEVLGSEEVHEENGIKPGNIASLLGDIAGIQIQQTNAATGNADMRIQGLQGKYTQILRDGMPLFGGYSGSFSILQIPPLDLQQIELVKGAASTLYGGGAIAGMLNLISKKPKLGKPEASFTLNRSTLLENNANLFFSGRNKKTGYTFFAGGTLQDPVDVNKDGFSDVPSVKSVFIHPRFFLYGSETSTVILGYTLNYEGRNGGDMQALNKSASPANAFFIQNKSWRNTADIVWEKKLAGNAQLTTKASTSFFNRDVLTNSFGMSGKQLIWYTEIAYSNKTEHHNYVMGINFNGDEFTKKLPDSTLLQNEKNNTIGFFAQDDWKFFTKFTLQTGLRVDVHNNYGTYFLPRLSLMYKANQQVTMRIGGGLGYKTPSLFNTEVDERQYRYIVGYKTGTTAERSYGANFDINYKTAIDGWNLTFNQTFFYNRIDKPIILESLPTILFTPVYRYENQQEPLETAGFETYIAAHKNALELYLGYVYTNAKRKYNPAQPNLPLIARNKLATVIAYEFSNHFRAGVEASYTGKQFLDNGQSTTPYVFAALMMRYNIGKTSLVLNCENLFDYRQNKNNQVVFPPVNNPYFPEIWAPLDGRVVNLSLFFKLY
ncbi:MAG: TonB-dependent receptor [Chitinophagia bacterium]|jgi:iron complex outermembrane receptor protein/outer membrane receptor for ferrienterochelin and colicins